MTEEWRDAVGYEGWYQVSNLGRVRSVERQVKQVSRSGNTYERTMKERVVKPRENPGGYLYAHIAINGVHSNKAVHHMVLEAFVGPRPANTEGCHNDGRPKNNRLDNLRWDTHSANELDKRNKPKKGLLSGILKEDNYPTV